MTLATLRALCLLYGLEDVADALPRLLDIVETHAALLAAAETTVAGWAPGHDRCEIAALIVAITASRAAADALEGQGEA